MIGSMTTVTIGIASRDEINARFKCAMTIGKRTAPFIGFADERALRGTPDVTSSFASFIDSGAYSKAEFLAIIAAHPTNQLNVDLVGL